MNIIQQVKSLNTRMEEYDERLITFENKLKQLNAEVEDIQHSSTMSEFNERAIQFNKDKETLTQEWEELYEEQEQIMKAKQQLEG